MVNTIHLFCKLLVTMLYMCFLHSSVGKKSACNVGDLGLIPELGRSLEEAMATHSSILAWRIPMDIRAWWATVQGVTQSWTRLGN